MWPQGETPPIICSSASAPIRSQSIITLLGIASKLNECDWIIIEEASKLNQIRHDNTLQEATKMVECLTTGLSHRLHYENTSIKSQGIVLDPRLKQKGFSNSNLFKQCCDELLIEMGSMNLYQ
uniref:Uncharacterized protein n=1 Tax=Anopheles funestus TaxID=62324 RepID=A0A182S0F1_ANOFN